MEHKHLDNTISTSGRPDEILGRLFLSSEVPQNWQAILEREQAIREIYQINLESTGEKRRLNGTWSRHRPVQTLVKFVLPKVLQAIQANLNKVEAKVATRNKAHLVRLSGEPWQAFGYIAFAACLDGAAKHSSAQEVINKIRRDCRIESKFAWFRKTNIDLYELINKQQKQMGNNEGHVIRVLSDTMDNIASGKWNGGTPNPAIAWPEWDNDFAKWCSLLLFDVTIAATGLFNLHGNRRELLHIVPTEALDEWVKDSETRIGLMGGYYMPLPAKPRPWTTTQEGGFWSIYGDQVPLVKNHNSAYQEELLNHTDQLQGVFKAVNGAQNTAWRVNAPVYDVLRDLIDEGRSVAGLPSQDRDPEPLCPRCGQVVAENRQNGRHACFDIDKDAFKQWCVQAAETKRSNNQRVSKVIALSMAVECIETYLRHDEEFYFIYQVDFRGRLYPLSIVSPQGADYIKGCLEFAQGKPLGETGAKWLAVHVSNTWGNDKASYHDRIQWTEDNTAWIVACAQDPLNHREWTEADSPFCFLAACREWAGYKREGISFCSRIPIALDGSCSGIQHYSAMLRDKVGAQSTNVIMTPGQNGKNDIYKDVAEAAKTIMQADLADGEKGPMATFLLKHDLINRKVTKRSVMTLPYGSRYRSCFDYVRSELVEKVQRITVDKSLTERICKYAVDTIWRAIPAVVIGAREGMAFLQRLASLACHAGTPVTWTPPSGLPVEQSYYEFDCSVVDRAFGGSIRIKNNVEVWVSDGRRIQLVFGKPSRKIDKARQSSGIAPNFIHSLDASHLMFCVQSALDNGINDFALVHDSLGVHAADTQKFFGILKQQFYRLYTEFSPLETFIEHLKPRMTKKDQSKIPELPYINTLDLRGILDADYLFS